MLLEMEGGVLGGHRLVEGRERGGGQRGKRHSECDV